MSFDNPFDSRAEKTPHAKVEVEQTFKEFVPEEFLKDPVGYFEREGKNIKTGDIKTDENGVIREDPTAVKDLPAWRNTEGKEIVTVGRRVNTVKGAVGESGDPFYEYKILEKLAHMGLPAARPVAKAEQDGKHIIVTERIPGMRWSERHDLGLKEKGYSDNDIESLLKEAEQKMNDLKIQFEQAGVVRSWKLKDMVFQIDIENKKILNIIPTDWERTRIDEKQIPRERFIQEIGDKEIDIEK